MLDGPERVEAQLVAERPPARACSCTPGARCRAPTGGRRGSRRTGRISSARHAHGGRGARADGTAVERAKVRAWSTGAASGRSALVTGAASGIGAATARVRRSARTSSVRSTDGRTRSTSRDERRGAARVVDGVVAEHGRIDGVVNAAGVAGGGPGPPRRRGRVGPRHRRQPHRHVPRVQARGRGACSSRTGRRRAGLDRDHRQRRGPRGHRGRQRPTTRRRAASCCSRRTWPSTTADAASGPTPSAPASSTRR